MTRSIVQRGLYFDELEPGVVYEHRPRRTVSEADNILFTTLTMNTQALHLDAVWSEATEFGERLVNSMFTLSTLVGLSVAQLTQGTIVANLGFSEIRFPAPVRVGDTLEASTVVHYSFDATLVLASRPMPIHWVAGICCVEQRPFPRCRRGFGPRHHIETARGEEKTAN